MAKAHLMLHIDTTSDPPTIVGAGIYGSSTVTADLKRRYPVEVFSLEGPTFEGAVGEVCKTLNSPGMAWLAKLILQPQAE